MHRGAPLCLFVLLALAGCGAVLPGGGPSAATTPTATPAPVPVDDGETRTLPPGVGPERVDAARLAEVTARSVRGETIRFQFDQREARPEFSLGTVYVGPRLTVEAVAADRYTVRVEEVNERGGGLSIETFENATYVTPDGTYRYDGENVTVAGAEDAYGRPSRLAATYVETYLDVETVEVRRLGNGSVVVEGEGGQAVNGTDYSVRAVVGPDGVVRSFEGIYTRDGRVQFATFSLSPRDAFQPPEWYRAATVTASPTATAATAVPATTATGDGNENANGTVTPTPTP
ncbi:hypothetical protein N0B31_09610 [Salinirubellus salinus]|uniref:Lipoprotein n=1 Tax=Salinirubellus salinus TaxID=1364945 RepID=A0A9E7R8F1_9EURY|nr:hypothetical protein [Salinirubellus salinus]UWM56530.1 hypothetical protein N0B31_09610 [Salinirubellus salinus]